MDEIRLGKDVSRNASEFGSASLHILIATNLPDVVKSSIGGEATGIRSRRAIRGERKQRASKVELGTSLKVIFRQVGVPVKVVKKSVHSNVQRTVSDWNRSSSIITPSYVIRLS